MMYAAIALFVLSAVLGLTILIKWLTKKDASRVVVYSHGIVASIALGIIIYYACMHPDKYPKVSLILFILSALVGFNMFFNDFRKKMTPLSIALVHALIAVSG